MRALILNSGMGTRMGDETKIHPKCMTVLGDGSTILERQLTQLSNLNICNVVITTGYCSEMLEEYAGSLNLGLDISYVKNNCYDSTNYIYSIYRAAELLDDDIILMHGDLVFDEKLLSDMLKRKESCMAVETDAALPEKDFKAIVRDGKISCVGVSFFDGAVAAQPLYKLNREDWNVWLDRISSYCKDGNTGCYAENALNEVTDRCAIYGYDVNGLLCREVDTMEDLEHVNSLLQGQADL